MRFCLVFTSLLLSVALSGQVQLEGTIKDASTGEVLPFVSIYLNERQEIGAVSNLDGSYRLVLPKAQDSLEVVFQYVGYETQRHRLFPESASLHLDIALRQIVLPLKTVEISADAEDPAYGIMRKVIARRKQVKASLPAYNSKVYVKGLIRLLDTPEQIFGQEVGDLGGVLDTAGAGVLYFSESFSHLRFLPPDRLYEQVLASKVSGSNEFGFNTSLNANLDLYENVLPFQRPIVSPIADQALRFYRYRLEGSFFDKEGREIDKIRCWPRQLDGPAFQGMLYVLEGSWLLTGAELSITGASLNESALDSLAYRLSWAPVVSDNHEHWLPLTQSLRFTGHVMGFVFGGYFINNHGEYGFPERGALEKEINEREVFVVLPNAMDQGRTFFDSLRPLPLTEEEALDYRRKDSLQAIWESPAYLDSMDRRANKFTFNALLQGYTHRNSRAWRSWGVYAPLQRSGFNAVQGVYYGLGAFFKQGYDKNYSRYLYLEAGFNWGYAEHRFRPYLSFVFRFNQINQAQFKLDAGMRLESLNRLPVPTVAQNELASLYKKSNLLRLYENTSLSVSWKQELWNGFWVDLRWSAFLRRALLNHSNYSLFYRNRLYETNHPDGSSPGSEIFPDHVGSLLEVDLRWRPGQRYMLLPGRKIVLQEQQINLGWHLRWAPSLPEAALPFGKWKDGNATTPDYLYLALSFYLPNRTLGALGQSEFFAKAGFFPLANTLYFPDQKHFWGNRTWLMGKQKHLYRQFLRLPYFKYSTVMPHAELHWQHHFKGWLTDKLPLLRKWNIATVFSARALAVEQRVPYTELALGWENLGFAAFRFWRIDLVAGFSRLQKPDWGVFLSSTLEF